MKIGRFASKANSLDLDISFTSTTIGYDKASNFDFDLDFQHGSLRDSEGFNFTIKDSSNHNKKYNGYYGSQDSGNTISVTSRHGSVSFKKQ